MNPKIYQKIVESLQEGVVLLDSEGSVVVCNAAASNILGSSEIESSGCLFKNCVQRQDLVELVALVQQRDISIEETLTLSGEVERRIRVFCNRLQVANGGFYILLVFSDVTQLYRLERVRRDFVANVSHELKTPITSIKASVETLLDGALDERRDAERFLKVIGRQSERLLQIVEDLLSLSRLQSAVGRFSLERQKCSMLTICSRALDVVREQAQGCNVKVDLVCPSDIEVELNLGLILQALTNLLENAIKSCAENGLVRLSVRALFDRLEVTVSDNGCGIAPSHLDRIFERFYRVDAGRGRDSGGSGLGLSIVKHIVQAHGGDVGVTSILGEGSTFTVRLPLFGVYTHSK